MKKRRKNIIKAVSVVGIVIILGIVWIIYNNLKTDIYIFPENLIDYMGFDVEQQIEDINRTNSTQDICTDVYAMENGSLVVKLNKKQWDWWIENVEKTMEKSKKAIKKEGGKITVSDDQKSVIFEVPSGVTPELIFTESFRVTICAAEYQILTEENQNWEIYLCFKNIETGEIIADGTLPYDTIEFMDEDLE